MSELLEITMVVCFGMSWPISVLKSYRARTTKGKSIMFLVFVFVGYIAGIFSKFLNADYMANFSHKWYVVIFYFINFFMVGTDIVLYFRNKMLDRKAQKNV